MLCSPDDQTLAGFVQFFSPPKLDTFFHDPSGSEELEREKNRQVTAQAVKVKENQWGDLEMSSVCSPAAEIPDAQAAMAESRQDREALNLFLQKPSTTSPKLSHLLGAAGSAEDSNKPSNNGFSPEVLSAAPHPGTQRLATDNSCASVWSPPGRNPWMTCSPQSSLQEEQYSKMLAEKSSQWFSLLPRSPCDESSVTSGSSPADSASSPVPVMATKSPWSSSSFPYGQCGSAMLPGIKSTHTPISQVSGCFIFICKLSIFKAVLRYRGEFNALLSVAINVLINEVFSFSKSSLTPTKAGLCRATGPSQQSVPAFPSPVRLQPLSWTLPPSKRRVTPAGTSCQQTRRAEAKPKSRPAISRPVRQRRLPRWPGSRTTSVLSRSLRVRVTRRCQFTNDMRCSIRQLALEHMHPCEYGFKLACVSRWQRCSAAGGGCPKWRKCKV